MMIGFVGVGNMGGAMALRLLESGRQVAVCDIDPARVASAGGAGARAVDRPAALASCALVVVAVVDAAQTRAVLFDAGGLAAALPAGATVMLCPTIAAEDIEDCAARLGERGIATIDAPMSGGPARARAGTMSLMVACDDAVFDRWQPVLRTLASGLFRVGTRIGDGARTKLVNNLLAAINLAGAAEAMTLAGRLGLDPARTLAVVEQSSGQSWIGSDRLRRALAGATEPQAHMTLLAKDSALALAAATRTGLTLPVGAAASRHFAAAVAAGLADADDSALWRWLSSEPGRPESAP